MACRTGCPTKDHSTYSDCLRDAGARERMNVEWHHFAPSSVFGMEADRWPVMPLCTEHHVMWHTAMSGYHWGSARRGGVA